MLLSPDKVMASVVALVGFDLEESCSCMFVLGQKNQQLLRESTS